MSLSNNIFLLLKKTDTNWYHIGFVSFIFGLVCYFFDISLHVSPWALLWVCPVTAILGGFIVISRNRFLISASVAWFAMAPLAVFLFRPDFIFQLWHFHHVASVIVLLVILYHIKEVFEPKGLMFGFTSFSAYVMITAFISRGKINIIDPWWVPHAHILWIGVIFAVLSIIIYYWHCVGKK
jgi:hypothetical protein